MESQDRCKETLDLAANMEWTLSWIFCQMTKWLDQHDNAASASRGKRRMIAFTSWEVLQVAENIHTEDSSLGLYIRTDLPWSDGEERKGESDFKG